VSLALRFKAPIYTHESVLDKAGVVFEKGELPAQGTYDDEFSDEINYSELSNQELESAIKKAVKNEDYELAARLRDEISKRTNKTKE
jgi:protein-arginine kinase activator protein McsA